MNKKLLSIISLMIMSITIEANSFAEAFEKAKVTGYLRTAYEVHNVDKDATFRDGAVGGKLHIETSPFQTLSFGASFYSSNALGSSDNRGLVPFRGEVANGYAILGEAYLLSSFDHTLIKIGRQEIDTPFADTDDIGMVPNTFEAYILKNQDIEDTQIFVGQIQKMAGVDAPTVDQFSTINADKNMQVLGVNYTGVKNLELNLWYYHLEDALVDNITYLEASYESTLLTVGYEVAMQYAQQNYTLGKDVSIYGFSTALHHSPSALTLALAYNKAEGNAAFSGYGGGPFFSSSEYLIIDNAGANGSQLWFGLEWDATPVGIEGLTLSLSKAVLQNDAKKLATEVDVVASYEITSQLETHIIYSDLEGKNVGEDSAKHLRVFVDYRF